MRKVIIPPLLLVLLLFVLLLPVSTEQDHPVPPTPTSSDGFSSLMALDAAETPLVTFTVGAAVSFLFLQNSPLMAITAFAITIPEPR